MTPLETTLARIDQLATEAPDLLAFPSVPPDRLRALLFGLAIGDALGNTTESRRPRDRARDHGEITGYLPNRHAGGRRVGLPSDDTQMAFWLLEQLLDTGRLDPDALARTFAAREIYGIGQSVREFRFNLNRGIPWDRAGSDSAGNGAIMRVAPMLVLQPHRTGPDLARDIATCAAVTHNEPCAIASAVAWVRLLALLSAGTGGPAPEDILELFLETHAPLEGPTSYRPRGGGMTGRFEGTLTDFLRQTVPDGLASGLSVLEFGDLTYSGAFLLETLPVTLFIIARHGNDPDRAIRAAVNHTRDNDTIASLVASAMGALHGMDAFRPDWVTGLLGRTGADDDGRVQALVAKAGL
jgi:ADP-ribosyl-[dinitrogen reductase] hydrolase